MDYEAVMASRERLWSIFGEPHGWPSASLSHEADLADLVRHEAEMRDRLSFNYALFDDAETHLAGCVYVDPPERTGADAEISHWVVDALAGTAFAATFEAFVVQWVTTSWPFTNPRFIGIDVTWEEWLGLPTT
jgi:hypothetical protein